MSSLTFRQDLESSVQSVRCVIRLYNTSTIVSVGRKFLFSNINKFSHSRHQLETFRTRINDSNPATGMNQTGCFYKLYAIDTITDNNNIRKSARGQQKFKMNPCHVRPELWSIGCNKLVASPTGDHCAIQSIS